MRNVYARIRRMNILIIGGGVCGTSAAEDIRKRDTDANITIVSDEPHPLYSRVLLPHYIHGMIPRERVFLKALDWYTEQNIELVYDEVVALDCAKRSVLCATDRTFEYDKLLIAGGGTVNRLPLSQRPRAFHFQTLEDADAILAALRERDGKKTVARIIGGGFICMEFVDLFQKADFETHVHLKDDRFFGKIIDRETSDYFASLLQARGVIIHAHDVAKEFQNDTLTTNSGNHACDVLGIGIGLDARFLWAMQAGIEMNHGIIANAFLETNIPDVYAAGDCAEYENQLFGRRRRVGNWTNAQMQGRHAARVMFGEREPFTAVTSYSASVIDIRIAAVGDADPLAADEVIARKNGEGRSLLYMRDERLVGAVTINRSFERAPLTKIISAKTSVSKIKDRLSDPDFNLSELI